MRTRVGAFALSAVTVVAGFVAPARAYPDCDPKSPPDTARTQALPGFDGVNGRYVVPSGGSPTTMVVYMHGYRNIADSWTCHLLDAANTHHALAFALDYAGTGNGPDYRGWFVREGAADSISVAQYFLTQYPSIARVGILGVSMGGNSSGLAVAAKATRPGGATPLFDYWVDVEGATNVTETYLEANAVGPANAYAAGAVVDIEAECGGTLAEQPDCYQNLTVLARTPDIAASGIKGVVVVHGIDDGLVPHNQSRELTTALRAQGVPTDFFTVARRNGYSDPSSASDEGGTTLTGTGLDPVFAAAGQTYPAPLAGHGWEGSDSHLVIATGFDRLWKLLEAPVAVPADHEFLVDADLGVVPLA